MKRRVHEFDPVLYPRKIWVVSGKDIADAIQDSFRTPNDDTLNLTGWRGANAGTWAVKMVEDGKLGVMVWLISEKVSIETIAHEAVHVADCIFRDCGIEYDTTNDEHFAFFVGHIADWIWQVANTKEEAK